MDCGREWEHLEDEENMHANMNVYIYINPQQQIGSSCYIPTQHGLFCRSNLLIYCKKGSTQFLEAESIQHPFITGYEVFDPTLWHIAQFH